MLKLDGQCCLQTERPVGPSGLQVSSFAAFSRRLRAARCEALSGGCYSKIPRALVHALWRADRRFCSGSHQPLTLTLLSLLPLSRDHRPLSNKQGQQLLQALRANHRMESSEESRATQEQRQQQQQQQLAEPSSQSCAQLPVSFTQSDISYRSYIRPYIVCAEVW
jgi:hypothetical protein